MAAYRLRHTERGTQLEFDGTCVVSDQATAVSVEVHLCMRITTHAQTEDLFATSCKLMDMMCTRWFTNSERGLSFATNPT